MNIDKNALNETLYNFVVPLISILVSVVLYFIVISPALKELPIVKAEAASKATLKDQLQAKLTLLNKLGDFRGVLEENEALVADVLSADPLVPELLTQIHTIATESGLDVSRLSYAFNSGGSSSPASAEALEADVSPKHSTVLVSLGVEGTYEQLVSFFNNLENSARMVNVDNFRYSGGGTANSGNLAVSVSLSSPYQFVVSNAITDTPIDVDVTDPEFVSFMAKLKALNVYQPSVDNTLIFTEGTLDDENNIITEDDTTDDPALDTESPVADEVVTEPEDISDPDSPFAQ